MIAAPPVVNGAGWPDTSRSQQGDKSGHKLALISIGGRPYAMTASKPITVSKPLLHPKPPLHPERDKLRISKLTLRQRQ
jgi:hypothetical protein